MKTVYLKSHSLFSPLGRNSTDAFQRIIQKESSLKRRTISKKEAMVAAFSKEDEIYLNEKYRNSGYSLLEQICIESIADALKDSGINPENDDCLFIFSSTKGNIAFLSSIEHESLNLKDAAKKITTHFKNPIDPIVVSNACISGALALTVGKRYLENGLYKHAIVFGGDVLSDFVFDGFSSFQALSDEPCRPFDSNRKGLNLGEAAACMILSVDATSAIITLAGAAVSNDANHLSGPSRTGEELSFAITKSLKEAGLLPTDIFFVAAHGTATMYNDEMESKALTHAKVNHAPIHSLKSYTGHTLGAAGIIESIIGVMALEMQISIPSLNFSEKGVSAPISVTTAYQSFPSSSFLKTASGFGGCNIALVWKKI